MLDADGRPSHVYWGYNRNEMIADAVIHVLGIVLGITGAVVLVTLAGFRTDPIEAGAVALYALCLVVLLSVSAAYNMWPISRTKWLLRRFDHACIFILIAATYTPFLTRLPAGPTATALSVGVWGTALLGAAVKIALPGRFDRLSIVLCLLLGFSGTFAWDTIATALPGSTRALILAGGLTYTGGVVFHLWEKLRFQNALWHAFVLVASALFYSAVLDGVVLT